MTDLLVIRLLEAAIAADCEGRHALAKLLTEAADELESRNTIINALIDGEAK